MKDFVAFDFETANRNRHSICSVGMVFVEDGRVTDTVYEVINPEEEFDWHNIQIHGITPDEIKGAPTFDEFYHGIKEKIHSRLLVAHNLAFDGYALRDNLARYSVEPVPNHFLCTYQLARKLLAGHRSYSLKPLCQHYGIDLIRHHNALDDAFACANLMLKLSEENGLADFDSIYRKTMIKPGSIKNGVYRSSYTSKSKRTFGSKIDFSVIEIAENAKEHEFFGKKIVFTGNLQSLSRQQAAELAASKGGVPQNSITKTTDYVVVGGFADTSVKGSQSSKLKKAEEWISKGVKMEILSEDEFLKRTKK